MNPKLSFKQIEAFRSVMVSGTVVGAAKLLNVTQPVVSRTISLLESRLGYALFVRRGRRLLPTTEAEALYREVEHLFGGLKRVAQIAQDLRFQRAGSLRVGCLPALAQGLVPRAVVRFAAVRPNVTVFLQSLPSLQIAELVSTRQFDVGVVEMPVTRSSTVVEPLPAGRIVALMAASHRLAGRRRISVKDLDGELVVMMAHGAYGSFIRYRLDEIFSKAGASAKIGIETASSTIACALVTAGAGITLVDRLTAEGYVGRDLTICELEEELPLRYALIQPQLPARMPLADAFAAVLRQEFVDAGAGS